MSILTDFLKEQARRLDQPDTKKQLERWVQSEQALIRQLEAWLKEADPEGILKIEKSNHELREEKFGAYDAVLRMRVDLGGRRVDIVPRGGAVGGAILIDNDQSVPIRGWLDMTNDIDRYRLYRILDDAGERWCIKLDFAKHAVPLTQASFESAMVQLLK